MTTEKFKSLSKSEKKVIVAKDVLKHIKSKKYRANAGQYFLNINLEGGVLDSDGIKENIKKIKRCDVCAMGACLLSATSYLNKLTFHDLPHATDNTSDSWELLIKIFSAKELTLIENCFEGENGDSGFGIKRVGAYLGGAIPDNAIYRQYYVEFTDDQKRLTAIMKNIIRNKGKFIPKQDIK